MDIFALLTGSLCHDVGHPGLNNAYLINNEAELATLYNDRSVLESHHAATAFKLLKKPELNILKNLSTDEKKEFRSSVITTILATDMVSGKKGHALNILAYILKMGQVVCSTNKMYRVHISRLSPSWSNASRPTSHLTVTTKMIAS